MSFLGSTNEIIIGPHNYQQHQQDVVIDGERRTRGLIPRNYTTHPIGFYQRERALDIPLIPRTEWPERIRDLIANKAQLSDIRNRGKAGQQMPSTDQDGYGYCWCHSGTSAMLLVRAKQHQAYADLSAYSVGCLIKNYRNEGGWGAQGLDWMIEKGIATSQFWPQQSTNRSNDNPAMRENALLYRFTEAWMDSAKPQYDRALTFDQECTLLLTGNPVIKDENWWGHSICGCDVVDGQQMRGYTRMESGKLATLEEFDLIWGMNDADVTGYGVRIWNSWGDSWSSGGMGVLTGSQAVSDGATCPRVATAA